MNTKLTLLTLAFLPASVFAQITLDQTSYTTWTPGTDSVKEINGQTQLAVGANNMWDLSTVNYIPGYLTNVYNAGTNPAFTGATFNMDVALALAPGATYNTKAWQGFSATGWQSLGMSMTQQSIDLSTVLDAGDNLTFPAQDIVYSSPMKILEFPVNYGNNWNSTYSYSTNFNATIQSMMLSNTPGQRVTHVTQTDTVIGWGRMRVKDKAGNPTGYMDVLQIKTYMVQTDSFFLGGMAVANTMLQGLGLSQGMTLEIPFINYFRVGEVTPLVQMQFADGSYTNQAFTYVHANRLADPTGIADIADDHGISIYPNPTIDGRVTINIAKNNTGNWEYKLMTTTGQTVMSAPLEVSGGKATLSPTEAIAAGNYFLMLSRNGVPVTVRQLTIK